MRGIHLAVFALYFRHMALVTLYPCPVMYAACIGFCFRMLQLNQTCAGYCMLEVVEIKLLVVRQQLLAVFKRHMVGATVIIIDLLAVTPLRAGVAVVLDMALGT